MSRFKVAGVGAIVAAIGLLAVIGDRQSGSGRQTAIEIYAIADTERPLMQACEAAFDNNDIEFRFGVDKLDGCGCMTRRIADDADVEDYSTVSEILAVIVRFGADDLTDTEMVVRLAGIRDANKWPGSKVGDTTDRVASAIAYCGQPGERKSHEQQVDAGAPEGRAFHLAQSDR